MNNASLRPSWFDRFAYWAFIAALLFLAFLAGAAVVMFQIPPYGFLRDAWRAAKAHSEERALDREQYPLYLWNPANRAEKGLTIHNDSYAHPGYTMYISGHESAAILLDMEGNVVHRWAKPYAEVYSNPKHVRRMPSANHIYLRRAHVYPNGDLLTMYESPSRTPSGLGMVKLDRDSNVIWKYAANAHHDLDVGPDGTIYCLTNVILDKPHSAVEFLKSPIICDYLVVLSPAGDEQKKIAIFDAFANSAYRYMLDAFRADEKGDTTHTNTVNVIGADFAAHHPAMKAGQIMTCVRNANLIAVIDLEQETVVWAMRGVWNLPHDPDPLDNGRIMIFDNRSASHHLGSRVIEFDPITQQSYWIYSGTAHTPFFSAIRACQQRLPNDNVLITESDHGRLFEVTRAGEIVWEYINPVRGGLQGGLVPVVSGGVRYSLGELHFLDDDVSGKTSSRSDASRADVGPKT